MYRPAPRCSEALSARSICADSILAPPSEATDSAGSRSMARAKPLTKWERSLVMHGHPLRHRLERAEARPDRHGDEESEVEEGQDARHHGLRGAAGLHAHPAQGDEHHHE